MLFSPNLQTALVLLVPLEAGSGTEIPLTIPPGDWDFPMCFVSPCWLQAVGEPDESSPPTAQIMQNICTFLFPFTCGEGYAAAF